MTLDMAARVKEVETGDHVAISSFAVGFVPCCWTAGSWGTTLGSTTKHSSSFHFKYISSSSSILLVNFFLWFERCIQEPGRNRNLGSGICQELHQLFVFKLHLPEKTRGKVGQCTLMWTVHTFGGFNDCTLLERRECLAASEETFQSCHFRTDLLSCACCVTSSSWVSGGDAQMHRQVSRFTPVSRSGDTLAFWNT